MLTRIIRVIISHIQIHRDLHRYIDMRYIIKLTWWKNGLGDVRAAEGIHVAWVKWVNSERAAGNTKISESVWIEIHHRHLISGKGKKNKQNHLGQIVHIESEVLVPVYVSVCVLRACVRACLRYLSHLWKNNTLMCVKNNNLCTLIDMQQLFVTNNNLIWV